MTRTHPLQRPDKFQHYSIIAAGWHRGPDKFLTRPRGATLELRECKYCERGNITDHIFLQVSPLDLVSDLGTAGDLQTGQVSRNLEWNGNGFAPHTQRYDVPTSVPVGISGFYRHSPTDTNPYSVISIEASAATKTTGDAGHARTVLEGGVGKRYEITCQVGQRLITLTTTAVTLDCRKR